MRKWKQTMKKVGALVLALAMVVTMVSFPVNAEAAGSSSEKVLYLKPGTWSNDGARFGVWAWKEGDGSYDSGRLMTPTGEDGYYACTIPNACDKVIFLRMYSTADKFDWAYEWNRVECSIEGNLYTINGFSYGEWSHKHVNELDEFCSVCHPLCSDTTSDSYCDKCNWIVNSNLKGYTLSLDGNIGMNFQMELSREVVNDETAKMVFTFKNGNTQEIMVNSIQPTKLDDNKNYYFFTCEVAAKEMTEEIKAELVTAEGTVTVVDSVTVKDYADYILAHGSEDAYKNAVPLVKAMLNYGAYSQTYFNYNATTLANADLKTDEKSVADVADTIFNSYVGNLANKSSDVGTFSKAYLTLETTTTLNVLFELAEGVDVQRLTFKVGEETVTPIEQILSDKTYYRISKENIIFSNLENMYEFSVYETENTSNSSNVTYGAFTYANTILSNTDGKHGDAMKNVTRALWELYQAAEAYTPAN